jgi:hypothetical protein
LGASVWRAWKSAEAAALSLNINLVALEVNNRAEIEGTLATFDKEGGPLSGLIVAPNVVTSSFRWLGAIGCPPSTRLLFMPSKAD